MLRPYHDTSAAVAAMLPWARKRVRVRSLGPGGRPDRRLPFPVCFRSSSSRSSTRVETRLLRNSCPQESCLPAGGRAVLCRRLFPHSGVAKGSPRHPLSPFFRSFSCSCSAASAFARRGLSLDVKSATPGESFDFMFSRRARGSAFKSDPYTDTAELIESADLR
jgi:hypothetical protein